MVRVLISIVYSQTRASRQDIKKDIEEIEEKVEIGRRNKRR